MRILEVLEQLFAFCFFKRGRYSESINPPEFYSFKTVDSDLLLTNRAESSIKNFSPFFTNSLAMEINVAVRVFSNMQNYLPSDISRLQFRKNYALFALARSQKNNHLKEFSSIRINFHSWRKCNKKNNFSNCQSLIFTEDKVKATTIEDLQKTFFRNDLIKLKPGKVLITFVEEVSCVFSNRVSHATVLVIFKGADYFWAYYCNSHGHDMPTVLRVFLEETFDRMINKGYIRDFFLDCSNNQQQVNIPACMFFAIINANIISEKMLEGASSEEIRESLNYWLSARRLNNLAWKFFDSFGKELCCSSVRRIEILTYLIERLIQTPLLTCSNNQELEDLKNSVKALEHLMAVFKDISKTKKNIISESNKKFFLKEILKSDFTDTLTGIMSLLRKVFFKYYESLIILFEQKQKETNSIECKERIKARKGFCLERRKYLDFFYSSFSTFYNLTFESGLSPLERLFQALETWGEIENSVVTCFLCRKKQ